MADVASRTLSKLKVMLGRTMTFSVGDGTDKLLTISGMKMDGLTVNEEVKTLSHEMEDMQTVESVLARKVTLDFVFSELVDADIDTINGSTVDQVIIETSEGGANGNGEVFDLDNCDSLTAFMDGFGTHIRAVVSVAGNTLPWTLTDVSA